MAEKKVSELTEATTVSDADLFVLEQGGVAKKATAATLKTAFGGESDGSDSENEQDIYMDMSNWYSGSFTVTYEDGTTKDGTVEFDDNDRPTSVTLNGHTLTLTLPPLPEVE